MMRTRVASLIGFAMLSVLTACTSWHESTTDVTVHGSDIVYLRDERADLCFAVLFMANAAGTSVNQMSMTSVPCEKLQGVAVR